MHQPTCEWIALGYSVPATPSRGRVYVWRRLRALGVQMFRPGTAVLPNTRENLSQFEVLAEKIAGFSGEAHIIELNFLTPADNAGMRERFAELSEREYRRTLDECAALLDQLRLAENDAERAALEGRLKRALGRYRQSPLRSMGGQAADELERAASEVLGVLRAMPAELGAMLWGDARKKSD